MAFLEVGGKGEDRSSSSRGRKHLFRRIISVHSFSDCFFIFTYFHFFSTRSQNKMPKKYANRFMMAGEGIMQ
jgi:hypothetical protein